MIRIDDRGSRHLMLHLRQFAKKAIPYAARGAMNSAAFAARKEWVEQLPKSFTLRNTWTARSVRVERATGLDMRRMHSVVGSMADYMADQEHGATRKRSGKHGVPIPTSVASGEGQGARPRRRVVRRPNRMGSFSLRTRPMGSRKQRNAAAVAEALRSGRKFVFLDLERRKGIFRLKGGRRRPKVEMVWDLSRPTVRVPRNPTLQRTLKAVEPRLPGMYRDAVIQQLRRRRLFTGKL